MENKDPLGMIQAPEFVDVHDYKQTTPVALPNLTASLEEIESLGYEIISILPGFQVQRKLDVNRQPMPAYVIVFRSRETRKVAKMPMPVAQPVDSKLVVN